jgi:hypothetical protein
MLAEELTLRESRRIKTSLMMARLSTIKTLAGFDFSFPTVARPLSAAANEHPRPRWREA